MCILYTQLELFELKSLRLTIVHVHVRVFLCCFVLESFFFLYSFHHIDYVYMHCMGLMLLDSSFISFRLFGCGLWLLCIHIFNRFMPQIIFSIDFGCLHFTEIEFGTKPPFEMAVCNAKAKQFYSSQFDCFVFI